MRAFRTAHPHLDIAAGLVIAPTEASEQLNEHDYAIPWDLAQVRASERAALSGRLS